MVLLRLWFLLLSIALFCLWAEDFINNIFFRTEEKNKKKEKEKGMLFRKRSGGRLSRFAQKKYYPKRRCGDFF